MTTWKERGVVLDSDDEDLEDSQSLGSCGGAFDEDSHQHKKLESKQTLEGHGIGNSAVNKTSVSSHLQDGSQSLFIPDFDDSPSASLETFKFPLMLDDVVEGQHQRAIRDRTSEGMGDEISRSYVALSSPLSSPLSSLDPSQPQSFPVGDTTSQNTTLAKIHGDREVGDVEGAFLVDDSDESILEGIPEYLSTGRRSLRQRNPIQLRPYALEGEKYRRTLMSRGMKPLKLAQVQENSRQTVRDGASPDPDFESPDDSQNLNINQEALPSSAASSQHSAQEIESDFSHMLTSRDAELQNDEDEEFPDIDDLINKRSSSIVGLKAKRRKLTYSSRTNHRIHPLSTPLRREEARSHSYATSDIFDVPASPPATSPPVPAALRGSGSRIKNLLKSTSPFTRVASVENGTSNLSTPVGTLPTPATSAVKAVVDLTELEYDENEHLATDSDSELESFTVVPDQSVQIRQVGRRIRGVLPASWLRLDAHTRQVKDPQVARTRANRSLSPVKAHPPVRKGVALPKTPSDSVDVTRQSPEARPYFISDDDSEDAENFELKAPSIDHNPNFDMHLDDNGSFMETGSVIEDDYVDAMLPGHKRQAKLYPTSRKKNLSASKSLFQRVHPVSGRQPKITEHLPSLSSRPTRGSTQTNQIGRRWSAHVSRRDRPRTSRLKRPAQPEVPELSILDVINPDENRGNLPLFIRIAARNARSRKGLGRHSPTRKFIRLGDQEDTHEARTVLRNWREGIMAPRTESQFSEPAIIPRHPLTVISSTDENQRSSSSYKTVSDVAKFAAIPRKPLIARPRQTRIDWRQDSRDLDIASAIPMPTSTDAKPGVSMTRNVVRLRRPQPLTTRQAQLETSVIEQAIRHPNLTFGSTKKTLDALYRKGHKGAKIRGDIQLARFLADDDVLIDSSHSDKLDHDRQQMKLVRKAAPSKAVRRCKHTPTRLDTGAAKYRQPSEPLIIDFLHPTPRGNSSGEIGGKLIGLGTYGSTYTHHFDIFPLPNGTFFHESTFIGSGRLSRALSLQVFPYSEMSDCGIIIHTVAEKQLRWGLWDDVVSSELGVCFDWALEQFDACSSRGSASSGDDVLRFLTFVIDYVGNHLCFKDHESLVKSMSRFMTLLSGITSRLEAWATKIDSEKNCQCRIAIESSALVVVILSQLIKGFGSDHFEISLKCQFESLLQLTAGTLIKLLLVVGLDCVRKFYDDLQYLAVREQGVKSDSYAVHSWVILIHVLDVMQLPRASFWDLVNACVMIGDVSTSNDARTFERLWYTMFSLLPLCDFDKLGVFVPELSHERSLENWNLLQKILKRIFDLYSSNSRQAPSFNQYCRALFHRCHYLIEVWGWRKHSAIIGSLFDFFALHNLAHLRNEEAHKSPYFLEHLDQDQTLAIEQDDHCFHIFLKIVALSIKQLRKVADLKAIRNLAARVIPNHDRQYPKDETIRQRDLASLRNHHDLLCTLFWAAPSELRPSINLIRSLVDPLSCHREAYLIHLSAWSNIARFIISRTASKDTYKPFAEWEQYLFLQLVKQIQSVDVDVEHQLRRLPNASKSTISQAYIMDVTQRNKHAVITLQNEHISSLLGLLDNVADMDTATAIFKSALQHGSDTTFYHAFCQTRTSVGSCQPHRVLASGTLRTVLTYLRVLERLVPLTLPEAVEEDSQGYGIAAPVNYVDRLQYSREIDDQVLECCCHAVRCHTRNQKVSVRNSTHLKQIFVQWMEIIFKLCSTPSRYGFSDFAPGGKFAVFDLKDNSRIMRRWTIVFQSLFIYTHEETARDFLTTGQDAVFAALYLLCLPNSWDPDHHGHELLKYYLQYDEVFMGLRNRYIGLTDKQESTTGFFSLDFGRLSNETPSSRSAKFESVEFRLHLIEEIFRKMSHELASSDSVRERFVQVIQDLQEAMKREALDYPTECEGSTEFNKFLWSVSKKAEIHFNFAAGASSNFTPLHDPTGIDDEIDFKLRVYAERATTLRGRQELNFFCLALVDKMALEPGRSELTEKLLRAMQSNGVRAAPMIDHTALGSALLQLEPSPLEKHILTILVPAFLHVVFVHEMGFYSAQPFWNAAAVQLKRIAYRGDEGLALKYALPILRTTTNGLGLFVRSHVSVRQQSEAVSTSVLRIIQIIIIFYNNTFSLLWLLAKRERSVDAAEVLEHLHLFGEFARSTNLYFCHQPRSRYYLMITKMLNPNPNSDRVIDTYYSSIDSATSDQATLALADMYVDITNQNAVAHFVRLLRSEHPNLLFHHFLTVLGNLSPEMHNCLDCTEWIPKYVPFAANILENLDKNYRWSDPGQWDPSSPVAEAALTVRQGHQWVRIWMPGQLRPVSNLEKAILYTSQKLLNEYERLKGDSPDSYEAEVALKHFMMRTTGLSRNGKNGEVRVREDFRSRILVTSGRMARFSGDKPGLKRSHDEFLAGEEEFE